MLSSDVRGLTPDDKRMYAASLDGVIRAWNLNSFNVEWETYPNHGMGPAVSNGQSVWIARGSEIQQ